MLEIYERVNFAVGDIRLHRGSCFPALELIPDGSIDAVITDPPFGVTDCKWDTPLNLSRWWALIDRKLKPSGVCAMFCCGHFTFALHASNPRAFRYDLVWEKSKAVGFLDANRRPLRAHESILIFARRFGDSTYNAQKTLDPKAKIGTVRHAKNTATSIYHWNGIKHATVDDGTRHPRSVLRFPSVNGGFHPTQKPRELMELLVKSYSHRGDLVVDPFLGSGTTAEACAATGRRFFGCEKNRTFFRFACKRIAAIAANKPG